jgi:abortive infection bacteriophage resistance protein
LNRIEINFRTKVVYYASNKYQNATWFADKKVIRNEFVESFTKHYDSYFIENNKPIKKHHQKYINDKYAPAWKTLEFFTFGTIFKIYRSLNDENLKLEIASKFGFKHIKTFENYLNTIIFIRNTCAHGGVLFDLNTPTEIRITPLISFSNHNNHKHSLDSCIKIILYFLQTISNDRKIETEKQIDKLLYKSCENQTIKKIIENKMGCQKINI